MSTFNTQADFPDGLSNITAIVQSNETPAFRISPQLVNLSKGNQEIDAARADDIIGIQFLSGTKYVLSYRIVSLVMFGPNRDPINVLLRKYETPHIKHINFNLEITSDKIKISHYRGFYTTNMGSTHTNDYQLAAMVILRKEPA